MRLPHIYTQVATKWFGFVFSTTGDWNEFGFGIVATCDMNHAWDCEICKQKEPDRLKTLTEVCIMVMWCRLSFYLHP